MSGSPRQWLDPLLSRITKGIEGNTDAVFAMKELLDYELTQIRRELGARDRRTESRIAELQSAFDGFVAEMKVLSRSTAELGSVGGDKVRALEQGARALEQGSQALTDGAKSFKDKIDETGKQLLLMRGELGDDFEEGPAPKALRRFVRKAADRALNFVWPIAERQGKAAAVWILKAMSTAIATGALAKLIHYYVTGHHP